VALLRERLPEATLVIFWPHHQPYPGVQRVVALN
jgi:putative ATP-binding cassette transporter